MSRLTLTRFAPAAKMMRDITAQIPPSHGAPHALRVSEFARILARSVGIDPEVAGVTGLFHDLRFFDEEERRARKLNIPSSQTGKKDVRQVLAEFKAAHGWPSNEVEDEMLYAILHHSELPTLGTEATPLLRVLRDADRLSRQGREGLVSILEANKQYSVAFYNNGEPIKWCFATPLIRNEEIKSAVTDVRACLSWWQIMETPKGWTLFKKMYKPSNRFLNEFEADPQQRDYDYWIDWASRA